MLDTLLLVLTALIPLLPIGTRLYFTSQVERSIDKLKIEDYENKAILSVTDFSGNESADLSDLSGKIERNSLNHDERGFRELKRTVQQHRPIGGDIRSFHLLWGDMEEISNLRGLTIPTSVIVLKNGILCIEYSDRTFERVLFHAADIENTAKLTDLSTWSRETATIESYHITLTLVFSWTIVSLVSQLA